VAEINLAGAKILKKAAEALPDWPLYKLTFDGDVIKVEPTASGGSYQWVFVPQEISQLCLVCQQIQRWEIIEPKETGRRTITGTGLKGQINKLVFRCKNCEKETVTYFLKISISEKGGTIIKVGQFPPLERAPSAILASVMDKNDKLLYRNALTCRNSNQGIGAVAYLRRIIENNIDKLFDLEAEELAKIDPNSPELAKLIDMKADKRFSAKVNYAADLLPKNVRIDGQNPIPVLHSLASQGLHGKSDDECTEIFDQCKLVFEYVIKRLKEAKDEDDSVKSAMKALSEGVKKK
jgi:hypothetical protein